MFLDDRELVGNWIAYTGMRRTFEWVRTWMTVEIRFLPLSSLVFTDNLRSA